MKIWNTDPARRNTERTGNQNHLWPPDAFPDTLTPAQRRKAIEKAKRKRKRRGWFS